MINIRAFLLIFACCAAMAHATEYFPIGNNEGQVSAFHATWYGDQLKAMKEPSLFGAAKDRKLNEVRFLWLRSFDKAIAVRAYMSEDGPRLHAVRLSAQKDLHPGTIEWTQDIALSDRQWKTLLERLSRPAVIFPYRKLTNEQLEMTLGSDGAQWILESALDGTYHIADVWSPTSFEELKHRKDFRDIALPNFNAFAGCCLYFLKIAGIKNERIY
jgi:hypothetical protein